MYDQEIGNLRFFIDALLSIRSYFNSSTRRSIVFFFQWTADLIFYPENRACHYSGTLSMFSDCDVIFVTQDEARIANEPAASEMFIFPLPC